MERQLSNKRRSYALIAALTTLLLVGLFVLWLKSNVADGPAEYASVQGIVAPAAAPVSLHIPSVGINTTFSDSVGVTDRQEIEVPDEYDSVAYYKHGPTPGELGPSVVLGHVDSKIGPAIFYSLGQVEVGDLVSIARADDTVLDFEITELVRNNQGVFPTDRVYGNIDHAGLRLVTCSGVYDRKTARYSHNLIVYAKLVEIRSSI